MQASNAIIRCLACGGSGSMQCIKHGRINPGCISLPLRSEERCNCCDGKGWVIKDAASSPFCQEAMV